MADCDHPGCDGDDNLPHTCNFCTGQFCAEHRLPEKHYCVPKKPTQDSSPDFRETDDGEEQQASSPPTATSDRMSSGEQRPSSRDPPTAKSPAVETKDDEPVYRRRSEDTTSSWGLRNRAGYAIRRVRYYIWRTVGAGLTLAKYAAILAVVALAVIGAAAIIQPSLLAPLSDAGVPVPEGENPSETGGPASDVEGVAANATATTTAESESTATAVSGDTKRERVEN